MTVAEPSGRLKRYTVKDVTRHYIRWDLQPMSREEEMETFRVFWSGTPAERQQARHKILLHNMRFVVKLSKRFANNMALFTDVLSAATLGMDMAIDRYDGNHDCRFITFAVWWIRQAISLELKDGWGKRGYKCPSNRYDDAMKIQREISAEEQRLGRRVFIEEMARKLGWTKKRLLATLMFTEKAVSIDDCIFDDESHMDGMSIGEMIPDPAERVDERMEREESIAFAVGALAILDKRERRIISALYGLEGDPPMKMTEVGVQEGLSRERIRQIRNEALEKMRKHMEDNDMGK